MRWGKVYIQFDSFLNSPSTCFIRNPYVETFRSPGVSILTLALSLLAKREPISKFPTGLTGADTDRNYLHQYVLSSSIISKIGTFPLFVVFPIFRPNRATRVLSSPQSSSQFHPIRLSSRIRLPNFLFPCELFSQLFRRFLPILSPFCLCSSSTCT